MPRPQAEQMEFGGEFGSSPVVAPWVALLGSDWEEIYRSEPNWGQIGRELRPLLNTYTLTEVQIHFRHYLKETPPRFVSLSKFRSTFGAWSEPIKNPPLLPYKPSSKFVYDCAPGELRGKAIQVAIDDPRPAL